MCGTIIFMRAEALESARSVSVGCFEDPDFAIPQMLHWPNRKHRWLRINGVPEAAPPD